MFDNKNELEARQEILGIVDEYCKKYHNQKQYKEGDRISYASRVYDSKEMMNLVDSALELNSGLQQAVIQMNLRRSLENISE